MRGFVIAFVGSDGTGKSSIARLLKSKLEQKYSKVSLAYMGAANPVLFTSRLLLKLGEIRDRRTPSSLSQARGKRKPYSIIRDITFLHYIVELFVRYLIRIWPKAKEGEIVIVDRYLYDFLIFDRFFNRYDWFKNLIIYLIPKADIVFCLHNDADVVLRRKLDNSAAEIARQTEIFFSLEKYIKNFKKVKTDGTLEETADEILCTVEQALNAKQFYY